MPISDEIIELEPVKKTKLKMIIMLAAAGVLLALAVTFLVLYLVKPNVKDSTGQINGVFADHETTLFSKSVGEGDESEIRQYASVANEYIVYATVSSEGDADPKVTWSIEPFGAVRITDSGNVQDKADEFFCKFIPTDKCAGLSEPVTLTARSLSDTDKRVQIKFYVVNQGTASIELGSYGRVETNAAATKLTDGARIEIPYVKKTDSKNQYYLSFEQRGMSDDTGEKFAPLTVVDVDGGKKSDSIDVTSSRPDVLEISNVSEHGTPPRFEFKVKGEAKGVVVTLVANKYNDSAEYTKTIEIDLVSSAELGIIDGIYFSSRPVDANFFAGYSPNDSSWSTNEITIPYRCDYDNILSHIVLSPLSVQYEKGAVKTDWYQRLKIESSNSNLTVDPLLSGKRMIHTSGLAKNTECILTISDQTGGKAASIGTSLQIKVNIVAQNPASGGGSASVIVGSKTYTDDDIKKLNADRRGIASSQGSTREFVVSYTVAAPVAPTAAEAAKNYLADLVSKYMSTAYSIELYKLDTADNTFKLAPNSMNVALGGKAVQPTATANKEIVNNFAGSNAVTVTPVRNNDGQFRVDVKFAIEIGKSIDNGLYRLLYKKVLPVSAIDNTNNINGVWSTYVNFEVAKIATTAQYKSSDKILDIITGSNPNDKTAGAVSISGNTASINIQNKANGTSLGFDFADLVTQDDSGRKVVNVTATYGGFVAAVNNNTSLQFKGANASIPTKAADVTITAYNADEKEIGRFTVNVYVFDAISEIACEDASIKTISYGGTPQNSVFAYFDRDKLTASRLLSQTPLSYSGSNAQNKIDIDLLYGGGTPLTGSWSADHNVKTYKHNGTTVFTYNANEAKINVNVDLFAYSYENNVNLGDITVRYSISKNEYDVWTENFKKDEKVTRERIYKFVRQADDVYFFTDPACAEQVLCNAQSIFCFAVDQGDTGAVYSSEVVKYKDASNVTKTVVVRRREVGHTIAAVSDVYFVEPKASDNSVLYNVTGESHGDGVGYKSVRYDAPNIGSKQSQAYTSTVIGVFGADGSTPYKLEITVQNFTRSIDKIELFSDSACTNKLSASAVFDFDRYNGGAAHYENTFYIKATYKNESGTFTRYEPVLITLPDGAYLELSVNGGASYSAEIVQSISDTVYSLSKNSSVFPCTVRLRQSCGSAALSNDAVVIQKAYHRTDNDANSRLTVPVSVGTGLFALKFSVSGNTYTAGSTVPISVSMADLTGTTVDVGLIYETLAAKDLYDIVYDTDKLLLSGSGLNWITCNKGNDRVILTISPAQFGTDSLKARKYTLTLTDKAGGANAAFTVTLEITLEFDIFALSQPSGGYALTTTGGNTGSQTAALNVTYNNGVANIQPESTAVSSKIYKKSGSTYTAYSGNDVKLVGNTITVANSVLSGTTASGDYYVCVYVGDIATTAIKSYAPIVITTSSKALKLAENGNIAIGGAGTAASPYAAAVTVNSATQEFNVRSVVYNRGTNAVVSDAVTYGLYSNSDCSTASAVAAVNGGVIKFTNPDASGKGIVYCRASYTDAATGTPYAITVKITYTVALTELTVSGIDGGILSGNTITLYYLDANNYTYIDLSNHISVGTGFTGVNPGVTKSVVSNNTEYLGLSGTTIIPRKAGSGLSVTVKATFDGQDKTKDYTVNIVKLSAPTLALDGTVLDIAQNGSVTATANITAYSGLSSTCVITGDSYLTVSGANAVVKTVSLDKTKFVGAGSYGAKTVTAAVGYTPASGERKGLTFTLTETVTAENNYFDTAPAFKVVRTKDGVKTEISAGSDVDVSAYVGATYSLVFDSVRSDATYVLRSDNSNIMTIGQLSGNTAPLTFTGNAYGSVTLSAEITLYGASRTVTNRYTFTYGAHVSASMTFDNTAINFDASSKATRAIDYDGAAHKLRYYIDVSGIGVTIAADKVAIDYVGGVTATAVQYDGVRKSYYREFTVTEADSKLTVVGSVNVNGITFVSEKYTVEFTATEPVFEISGYATVNPASTANYSVSNTAGGFRGNFDVTYSVINGGGASIADNGVLTAPTVNTTDRSAIVRATVRVTSGAFTGKTYIVDKEITISGHPLPTVEWSVSQIDVFANSEPISLSTYLKPITGYYSGNVVFRYAVDSTSGVPNGVFGLNETTGAITVHDNEAVRAGGAIYVRVTGTVSSGCINAGSTVSDIIKVRILPQAHAESGVTVLGKAGEYDLSSAVALYTKDADGYVKSTDTCVVAFYAVGADTQSSAVSFSTPNDGKIKLVADMAGGEITVLANVVIMSGEYAGVRIGAVPVTIVVRGFTPTSNMTAAWNDSADVYDDIDADAFIPSYLKVAGIMSVTIVALDNGDVVTFTSNNTNTAVIKIDKDANVSGSSESKRISLGFTVTTNDNKEYYGKTQLEVAPVRPALVATVDGETIVNVGGVYSYDMDVNRTCGVVVTEAHGFTVTNVTASADIVDIASFDVYGNEIVIKTGNRPASSPVTISATVNGVDVTYVLDLKVEKSKDKVFTVDNSTSQTFVKCKDDADVRTATFTSTWTLNSAEYKYLKSISISDRTGILGIEYVDTERTIIIDNIQYDFKPRIQVSSFTLTFTVDVSNIGDYNFDVICTSHKSASTTSDRVDTKNNYTVRVVGDITVTLNANGGTPDSSLTVSYGDSYQLCYVPGYITPTRDGYNFVGWYTGRNDGDLIADKSGNASDSEHDIVTGNIELYAHWTKRPYVIKLDPNDGKIDNSTDQIEFTITDGEVLGMLKIIPVRDGYIFQGWWTTSTTGGKKYTAAMTTDSALSLYARWTAETYTVTFAVNDGATLSGVATKDVTFGATFGTLPEATRSGYTFDGWYFGNECVTANTTVTTAHKNAVLTARWTAETYTVTFNVNGGNTLSTDDATKSVTFGATFGMLPEATRSGYTFDGWYFGGALVTENTLVTTAHKNAELAAHWTQDQYTVTLYANASDGTILGRNSFTFIADGNISLSAFTPVRSGYTFDGWFTSAEGGEELASITDVTGDVALYAHWTENPPSVDDNETTPDPDTEAAEPTV